MQYIVVTGAYGGMGKATIERLALEGYTVFALDKKTEKAKEHILPIEVDVTSLKSIQEAYEKVSQITNEVFAILHFAGIYQLDSFLEITEERLERIFAINVFGAMKVNQVFLPLLKKGSRIIMTTSELAPLDPLPFTGIYAVSKSTLDKYAYSLRMEAQLLGIHVSTIRAGAIKTKMLKASTDELEQFVTHTKLYSCNATKFKNIVDKVEAKNVDASKIASLVVKVLKKKKPKFAYAINRNFLLLLLNALPKRLQFYAIRKVLENKE